VTDYQLLYETCKQQAQIHAQEARCANHTIGEIYQICTGNTGEPGNWNGAEPVRKLAAQRDALLEALRSLDTLIDFSDDNVENVWTFEDTTAIEKAFALARSALELAATPAQSSKGE
jgi:hypothetical protein